MSSGLLQAGGRLWPDLSICMIATKAKIGSDASSTMANEMFAIRRIMKWAVHGGAHGSNLD